MSRRGRSASKLSLFAFQDIITSVTGIMILVTLILALELIYRQDTPPVMTAEITEQMQERIASNRAAIQEFQQRYEESTQRVEGLAGYDADRIQESVEALEKLNERLQEQLSQLDKDYKEAERRSREAQAELADRANEPDTVEKLVAQAQEKLQQLEELRRSNRLFFTPARGDSKNVWLVEVADDTLVAARLGEAARPLKLEGFAAFRKWATTLDRGSERFMLLVKPEGIVPFHRLRHLLEELRFDRGFDLVRSNETFIDPNTGAAPP